MKIINLLGAAAAVLALSCGGRAFAQDKQIEIFGNDDGDNAMMMLGLDELTSLPDMEMIMDEPFEFEGGMPQMGPGMMPDELNLSKDQMDKIKKIHNTVRKLNIPIKSDIELKHIDFKELMDSDTPDKDKISAKLKEIEALKTQMKINRVNGMIDFKNILTKDQREKLERMRMGSRHMGGKKMFMRHRKDKDGDSMGKDRDFMNKDRDKD